MSKPNKPGRPKKTKRERKTKTLTIHLTEAQFKEIEKAAPAEHRSMSAFVVSAIGAKLVKLAKLGAS